MFKQSSLPNVRLVRDVKLSSFAGPKIIYIPTSNATWETVYATTSTRRNKQLETTRGFGVGEGS